MCCSEQLALNYSLGKRSGFEPSVLLGLFPLTGWLPLMRGQIPGGNAGKVLTTEHFTVDGTLIEAWAKPLEDQTFVPDYY
jgi:hypothetical protein